MALRAVPDHPKFARLKSLIGRGKGETLGYLECLWHFTGRFTPQGNIGKYADADIESWIEWDGEEGALIQAFVTAGWIEVSEGHRLIVHDWHEHADAATKLALKRKSLDFVTTLSQHCSDTVPHNATSLGLPVPEPVPETVNPPTPQKGDGVPKRFVPPTENEVSVYMAEIGLSESESGAFVDFYSSKNWMVGKNKMSDWKCAVRNWKRRRNEPDGKQSERRAAY